MNDDNFHFGVNYPLIDYVGLFVTQSFHMTSEDFEYSAWLVWTTFMAILCPLRKLQSSFIVTAW